MHSHKAENIWHEQSNKDNKFQIFDYGSLVALLEYLELELVLWNVATESIIILHNCIVQWDESH